MDRIALNIGQGVYLPGLKRAVRAGSVDFYQGQALRNWVVPHRVLTWESIPTEVYSVLIREWERLELWAMYDKRDGREPIDY
ncbi:hypothetical protein SMD44_07347 [Streptomyces alboflavus]|uniref:Uncharacterized protein n=1 Tax=Streptomyces alboflavus TaxID=67267 RepID=A0A1Z1WN42_9ACTN|nr:hypothetical protein [Streptomyces alboflavus]ARX87865.1 hypothetical protein SMD44_07347 [Streptomyces alboflavus]